MKSSVSARFNADLLERKYDQWCEDPQSVEADWCAFFEGFELGNAQLKKRGDAPETKTSAVSAPDEQSLDFRGKVVSLVYNYRTLGHTQAHLNPLDEGGARNPRLELAMFGLSESDLEREVSTQFFRNGAKMKLRDMIQALEETYSGFIGFEFMHIHNTEVRNWIRSRIEKRFETQPLLKVD